MNHPKRKPISITIECAMLVAMYIAFIVTTNVAILATTYAILLTAYVLSNIKLWVHVPWKHHKFILHFSLAMFIIMTIITVSLTGVHFNVWVVAMCTIFPRMLSFTIVALKQKTHL